MVNCVYGRSQPRPVLAGAEYTTRLGAWPTHAHGEGVVVVARPPCKSSAADDHVEFRPDLAARVLSQLQCEHDNCWIDVSGPAGRYGYGLVHRDEPVTLEAYRWLYGDDPWRANRPTPAPREDDPDAAPGQS